MFAVYYSNKYEKYGCFHLEKSTKKHLSTYGKVVLPILHLGYWDSQIVKKENLLLLKTASSASLLVERLGNLQNKPLVLSKLKTTHPELFI